MLNLRIRELRRLRNLSQVQLAQKLGVSKQSVSNWENDNIQPSIEMLVAIAQVFSVSTDYLLGLDHRRVIDVTGLADEYVTHIQQVVDDMRDKRE